MTGFPTTPESLVNILRSFLIDVWNWALDVIWESISFALSPLSLFGKIGLLLGIGALLLVGIQASRQGYEGRVSQAVALMGFASVLLIIVDFLPSEVLRWLMGFVVLGIIVGAYNLKSYFAGDTESTEWYDTYRRLFGSLTLALILIILALQYVVGIDLPLLP
ncbi:hypothetical protein ACFQJC_03095 [Haloferax namakaokahaiae]|uniref:Uncharacterized protein n=1 Tax=Haloferax namakaokahaiae TaxID=1748331 RepID=A0ABD5ZBD6_9EURY